jgi:polysaccharide biosynthesis protein PslH
MKVLSLVSYNIFPAKLGGQKGIALFNEYLSQQCDLVCVTVKSNEPKYAKSYKLYNILSNSASRYFNLFYFFSIRSIIKKEGITHLILEHPYFGWLGILLKWFAGVKLVVHSHNIENTRWKSLGKWWWPVLFRYEKWTHRSADYNFFIQEDDLEYALVHFKLKKERCRAVTYGIEWDRPTGKEEKLQSGRILQQQYGLSELVKIFLFNGTLSYFPNLQAVDVLLEKINPALLNSGLDYRIIICGKGLPESYNELSAYSDKKIIYAGFVDDITVYFKAADLFLNPVVEGGGIKTKLVEAIGFGTAAISTRKGSIGVTRDDAGEMLTIVEDGDWNQFCSAIVENCRRLNPGTTPPVFYEKFFWGNIAGKAVSFISQ